MSAQLLEHISSICSRQVQVKQDDPRPWRVCLPGLKRASIRSVRGWMGLTASQASRVANGDAVVVVRARSATLRGAVKVYAHIFRPLTPG